VFVQGMIGLEARHMFLKGAQAAGVNGANGACIHPVQEVEPEDLSACSTSSRVAGGPEPICAWARPKLWQAATLCGSVTVSDENDADNKYVPVGAASILAKKTRDEAMERLCGQMGLPYVSGYANEATARALDEYCRKHGRLPPQVRRSRQQPPFQDLLRRGY
jgi:hypothetical protein